MWEDSRTEEAKDAEDALFHRAINREGQTIKKVNSSFLLSYSNEMYKYT